MARFGSSRSMRLIAGTAMLVSGLAIFVARPGVALAHHVTITEDATCDGWSTKAEYIGGPGDRKVVIDVTINGEHIAQTLYFDNESGHLGHVDHYMLYERTGTGSLTTSGSVMMYDRVNGNYTEIVDSDYTGINLVCAATPTATPPPTDTPVAPSATPTPTSTVEAQGTTTPIPTDTPAAQPTATGTPEATSTVIIVIDDPTTPIAIDTPPAATSTPAPSDTPAAATRTPIAADTPRAGITPASTPTLTSSVRGLVPPEQPRQRTSPPQPTGRAFPATGDGAPQRRGVAGGIAGAIVAGAGLAVVATGLRRREA